MFIDQLSLLQGAMPYSSLVLCKAAQTDPGSPAGWSTSNSGDYPPLPQPVCRGHTCRGHAIQVLPSHQRICEPGEQNKAHSRWIISLSLGGKATQQLLEILWSPVDAWFCPHRSSYGRHWKPGRSTWWCLITPPAPLTSRNWIAETSPRRGGGFLLYNLVITDKRRQSQKHSSHNCHHKTQCTKLSMSVWCPIFPISQRKGVHQVHIRQWGCAPAETLRAQRLNSSFPRRSFSERNAKTHRKSFVLRNSHIHVDKACDMSTVVAV